MIDYSESNSIARITLNRPEASNALSVDMLRQLDEAIERAGNSDARAAVLTGAGNRFFSCGGDLTEIHAAGEARKSYLREGLSSLHSAIERLDALGIPVVASVNGHAAGAGMSLVLACDYVIAAEHVKFTTSYTKAGLSPDGGMTHSLTRHVGLLRAKELILTGRALSAAGAKEWGIVSEVCSEADLKSRTDVVVETMAEGPTVALAESRRLLGASSSTSLREQLAAEEEAIVKTIETNDAISAIEAFVNKRYPSYKGR